MKFLESLRRPLDQFYQEATPSTCISAALPTLCTAMRTIESVSRYYARHGYLGLLFTKVGFTTTKPLPWTHFLTTSVQKVSNQIVNICKEYLLESAIIVDGVEQFWPTILKEVEEDLVNLNKDSKTPQWANKVLVSRSFTYSLVPSRSLTRSP